MDSGIKIENKYKNYYDNKKKNITKQFDRVDIIIKIIEIFRKIKHIFNRCIDKSPLLMSLLAGLLSKPAFHKYLTILFHISLHD